jgi:hypothetical protein
MVNFYKNGETMQNSREALQTKVNDENSSSSITEILPPELLLHIFSFLGTNGRTQASMVSQTWHAFAKDHQFRRLDIYTAFFSKLEKDLFHEREPQLLNTLVSTNQFNSSLTHPFTIGLMGNDTLRKGLLCLADGATSTMQNTFTEVKSFIIDQQSICLQNIPSDFANSLTPVLINHCQVILWCLPATEDNNDKENNKILSQELDKIKKLFGKNCETPLLVINISGIDINNSRSLPLHADDTIETFYKRIRLCLNNMELFLGKSVKPEEESKTFRSILSHCILS